MVPNLPTFSGTPAAETPALWHFKTQHSVFLEIVMLRDVFRDVLEIILFFREIHDVFFVFLKRTALQQSCAAIRLPSV